MPKAGAQSSRGGRQAARQTADGKPRRIRKAIWRLRSAGPEGSASPKRRRRTSRASASQSTGGEAEPACGAFAASPSESAAKVAVTVSAGGKEVSPRARRSAAIRRGPCPRCIRLRVKLSMNRDVLSRPSCSSWSSTGPIAAVASGKRRRNLFSSSHRACSLRASQSMAARRMPVADGTRELLRPGAGGTGSWPSPVGGRSGVSMLEPSVWPAMPGPAAGNPVKDCRQRTRLRRRFLHPFPRTPRRAGRTPSAWCGSVARVRRQPPGVP